MTGPARADALGAARELRESRDLDELALIAAGFPEFRLWRETTFDRTRYVARSRDLNTHPHTVVTTDLDELAATLLAGQQVNGGGNPQAAHDLGVAPARTA